MPAGWVARQARAALAAAVRAAAGGPEGSVAVVAMAVRAGEPFGLDFVRKYPAKPSSWGSTTRCTLWLSLKRQSPACLK